MIAMVVVKFPRSWYSSFIKLYFSIPGLVGIYQAVFGRECCLLNDVVISVDNYPKRWVGQRKGIFVNVVNQRECYTVHLHYIIMSKENVVEIIMAFYWLN